MILSMHVLDQPGLWFVAIDISGMKPLEITNSSKFWSRLCDRS